MKLFFIYRFISFWFIFVFLISQSSYFQNFLDLSSNFCIPVKQFSRSSWSIFKSSNIRSIYFLSLLDLFLSFSFSSQSIFVFSLIHFQVFKVTVNLFLQSSWFVFNLLDLQSIYFTNYIDLRFNHLIYDQHFLSLPLIYFRYLWITINFLLHHNWFISYSIEYHQFFFPLLLICFRF